jgi:hypothetical protein
MQFLPRMVLRSLARILCLGFITSCENLFRRRVPILE